MRFLIYASIACASLLISQAQAGRILDGEEIMRDKSSHSTPCRTSYIPDRYRVVGGNPETDVAFLKKVGRDPLSKRVAAVLPSVARVLKLLVRK